MKNLKLILFLLVTSAGSQAQTILTVDLDAIGEEVNDSSSQYYMPQLLDKMSQLGDSLYYEDYYHLYYGTYHLKTYSPYGLSAGSPDVDKFIKKKKYKKALKSALERYRNQPISFYDLESIVYCYRKLGEEELADWYVYHYHNLMTLVMSSGDGKSTSTAYVVLAVANEYSILSYLGLQRASQALLSDEHGQCDKLTLDKKAQKKVKGKKKTKELYFNVSTCFLHMSKSLKE